MSTAKYGPNSAQVEAFLERLKTLTAAEGAEIPYERWHTAWQASWDAAWHSGRIEARSTAIGAARDATPRGVRVEARDAATALVTRDLISAQDFAILIEPFKKIIAEITGEVEGKK